MDYAADSRGAHIARKRSRAARSAEAAKLEADEKAARAERARLGRGGHRGPGQPGARKRPGAHEHGGRDRSRRRPIRDRRMPRRRMRSAERWPLMPLRDAAEAIDRRVGDAVSAAVQAHHRRRLSRLDNAALDAPAGGWADDAFQPRAGQPPRAADRRRAGVRPDDRIDWGGPTEYVHITGWFLSPDFVMRDGSVPVVVRNLLAELAERVDVRVLLWAGAPVPLFRPSRRMARQHPGRAASKRGRSAASSTRASARCTATTRRRS